MFVVKTGYDFAGASGPFAYREGDLLTGGFIMTLGIYFIISSLSRHRTDDSGP